MKIRHGKKLKSAVAVLLAVMMLLGTTPAVFATTSTNGNSDTYNYVSLGASQTNGYGMRGYLDAEVYEEPTLFDKDTANVYGYQRAPEGSYPYLLSQYLKETTGKEVKLDQLAMSSMRAEEVRMLLDETYNGDSYTEWRFSAGQNWFERAGGLDKLRNDYRTAITDADLITVEVGVNNFGVYAINQITTGGKMFKTDVADILDEEELSKYNSAKNKIRDIVKDELGHTDTETIDLLADTFTYAYVGFATSFDEIIKKINELNADADIVVLSIPNMLYDVDAKIPGVDGTVPLGDIFGAIVEMANLYVSTMTDNRDTFMYAKAGNNLHVESFLDEILAYNGKPSTLSINMKDCFDVYDDNLHLRSKIQYMLEGKDQEVINKALETAYDITAKIMYEGAANNVIDLEIMLNGNMGEAEDKALKYIENSVMAGVNAVVQGHEYEFRFDEALMDDPAMATVFSIGVRSSIGNSFFAHPNENGHKEVRNAIIAAIKKGNTAKDDTDELITFEYEATEESYYVALGDTTVVGENSYAAKVKSSLGLTDEQFKNLGEDRMSAKEVLDVISDNSADIEKADLITLGFGNGQFIEYMGDFITENNTEEIDWTNYINIKYAQKIEAAIEGFRNEFLNAGMNEEMADMMITAVESYAYAYVGFLYSYPNVVAEIKNINPNANIIVVGMYNPIDGMILKHDGTELAIGEYIDYIVKLSNLQYKAYVLMTKNAIYVDAPDVETVKKYETVNLLGLLGVFRKPEGMYPNDNGHEYIKDKIMGAMKPVMPEQPDESDEPNEPTTPDVPKPAIIWGDADGNGIVNTYDASLILQYCSELVTAETMNYRSCDVDGNGFVNTYDASLILQYCSELIDTFPVEDLNEMPEITVDYALDKYDLQAYTLPYWDGSIVYNESVMVLENKNGSVSDIPLLYHADQIVSVRSSDLKKEYKEGQDYDLINGKLHIPEGSEISKVAYSTYYPEKAASNNLPRNRKYGSGYILYSENEYFHTMQIAVTYSHSDVFNGEVPEYKGDNLPKTTNKLKNGEDLKIVLYGDSIATGANSTSTMQVNPMAPTWPQMFVDKLNKEYIDSDISLINSSVGGTTSSWGIENVEEKVVKHEPELCIIAFGMNDGSSKLSVSEYRNNIRSIIEKVSANNPECEFVLISTMLPNEEVANSMGNQGSYRLALKNMEQSGVVVADMTTLHETLIRSKRYYDMTGNNINHPNDFLARAYTQLVYQTVVGYSID